MIIVGRVNTQLANEPNKRMLSFNNKLIGQLSSLRHPDSNFLLKNINFFQKQHFFDQVCKYKLVKLSIRYLGSFANWVFTLYNSEGVHYRSWHLPSVNKNRKKIGVRL